MERGLDIVILLDIYGELLSKGQRDALDMRYNADLSLSEIADVTGGVTRQSVSYSIKQGERRLLELEEKLGFAQRLKALSGELERAKALLGEIRSDYDGSSGDGRFAALSELLSKIEEGL